MTTRAQALGRFAICLLTLVPLCGCGGSDNNVSVSPTLPSSISRQTADRLVTFAADQVTYAQGQTITATRSEKNTSSQPIDQGGGCGDSDITISQNSKSVLIQVPNCNGAWIHKLQSGQVQAYVGKWDQKDLAGNQVAPGIYTLTMGSSAGPLSIQITIKP